MKPVNKCRSSICFLMDPDPTLAENKDSDLATTHSGRTDGHLKKNEIQNFEILIKVPINIAYYLSNPNILSYYDERFGFDSLKINTFS